MVFTLRTRALPRVDVNMLNLQLLSLLLWLSHRAYCQIATCNPTTDQLDSMWAGYLSPCTFNCHLDTWESSRCSLANISCGCGDCLSLDHVCLCATASWFLTVFECIGYNCTQSEQDEAASVAAGCSSYGTDLGEQAIIDVSMAYAAGMNHSWNCLVSHFL
jgi:hypothetical protein